LLKEKEKGKEKENTKTQALKGRHKLAMGIAPCLKRKEKRIPKPKP
jgi:hypothetical protein